MPIIPLYGHHALRARLISACERGALPSSLLLHGPRGVGKQRVALWLAQTLVCTEAPTTTGEPCGKCQACRYALELAHPDVHWFFPRPRLGTDATTSEVLDDYRGAIAERVKAAGLYAAPGGMEGIYIAAVRALVQLASMSPAMARYKVFIVGDAERMAPQEGSEFAANALLKLLEEPPANTRIILTSSEAGALLPTIRSRVVGVRVAPLPPADVEAFLGDARVADALRAGRSDASGADRVRVAAGAPGRLFGSEDRAEGEARARRLFESALSRSRTETLRAAVAQGNSRARGTFSDALDALTTLLAARTRDAVAHGDDRAALGASRAIESVEAAKTLADGNVNPSLITAVLLRELSRELA